MSKLQNYFRRIEEGLEIISHEVADEMYTSSQIDVPVDTGKLKRSGYLSKDKNESAKKSVFTAEVGYETDYAAEINNYRTPFLTKALDKGAMKAQRDVLELLSDAKRR